MSRSVNKMLASLLLGIIMTFIFVGRGAEANTTPKTALDAVKGVAEYGATVENVVTFQHYSLGSWRHMRAHETVVVTEVAPKQWEVVCHSEKDYSPLALVNYCGVPMTVARHLYTLREDGLGKWAEVL